jgi:hypothetical protein
MPTPRDDTGKGSVGLVELRLADRNDDLIDRLSMDLWQLRLVDRFGRAQPDGSNAEVPVFRAVDYKHGGEKGQKQK